MVAIRFQRKDCIMPWHQEYSRETATYGGFIVGFALPASLGFFGTQNHSYHSDIGATQLPPGLKYTLQEFFRLGVVEAIEVEGVKLRLKLSEVSPGGDQLDQYESFDLFRQVMTYALQAPIEASQWDMMPARQYERGAGFDTGNAGKTMAQLIDQLCMPEL